jgi:hypothetical protein
LENEVNYGWKQDNKGIRKRRDRQKYAAAKVVGTFDHPLLPMPPVLLSHHDDIEYNLTLSSEEDYDSGHGLSVVLCDVRHSLVMFDVKILIVCNAAR